MLKRKIYSKFIDWINNSHSSLDKFRWKFSSKIRNSYILYSKDVMIKNDYLRFVNNKNK